MTSAMVRVSEVAAWLALAATAAAAASSGALPQTAGAAVGAAGTLCSASATGGDLVLSTPDEFTRAMRRALDQSNACPRSVLLDGPFIGGSRQVAGDRLDPRPNEFNKWWSPADVLEGYLCDCCREASPRDCACHILKVAGIDNRGKDVTGFSFLTALGNFSNESAEVQSSGPVNVISPTWRNLATAMGSTFDQVFEGLPGGWGDKCSSGGVSEEVIEELQGYTDGCHPAAGSFLNFTAGHSGMDKFVNCSRGDCEGCTPTDLCAPEEFLRLAADLCTDAATVRAYMFCFLDANPQFYGTGYDEVIGEAGTNLLIAEYVTIPNLLIEEAGTTSLLTFGASGACPLV